MNVASLELCKELYELSDWYDTDFHYRPAKNSEGVVNHITQYRMGAYGSALGEVYPAYDLGYLLRKLQGAAFDGDALMAHIELRLSNGRGDLWHCDYVEEGGGFSLGADTPEDAACKLAIELIKQGVLKP